MMQSTEVLIIRHGQTDWNATKRLQGHSDTPLNEKGIGQALALADTLREEKLEAIFSSDLQRALRTAEEIAKWHNLPVTVDPAFRERSYGAFEGLSRDEIKTRYPESHAAWYAADPDHVFPPGERIAESIRAFHHRAIEAIQRIARPYASKKIVLIAHFGIIESAYRVAHDMPLEVRSRVPVLNTSINRFRVCENRIELIAWGDDGHLEPQQKPADYLKHF
ncbi:histidine phosphatase family protein [Oxalobacter vibrioformis]|uniref:Histidine phosphatase family protein n=1 Tax=Oxalobacter vibrioformis TaxID=933080 RepID=A0A9E9P3D9_9BURK|nr:histidine phosphatase family protein [Oxalobacter vibrioformis]WAW10904.1 histidine phosphatase family protein [Oxalobacter vibrioformis]